MSSKNKLILGLSLFFLLCVGGLYFALQTWMPFMWFLLGAGALGFAFVTFKERHLLAEFLSLKTTKHGLNMGTVLILILSILILGNYFSLKFVHVFDFSMARQYTLSEQSKKLLDHLDDTIDFKFFYKEGQQNLEATKKAFTNGARVFETYSPKVRISFVEMNAHPSETEVFGANKGTGEAFVSYKGKINRIEPQSSVYTEQDYLNAMIKSTRQKFKNIYFIIGHHERDSEDEKTGQALGLFRDALQKNSFKVQNLNLIQAGSIPEDADLLILAAPTEALQKSEMTLIDSYLKNGRPLLAFGENYILTQVDWRLEPHFVFNILNTPSGPIVSTDQPTVASIFSEQSEMTRMFGNNRSVLFYRPHPMKPNPTLAKTNMHAEILVKTSDKTVALDKIDTVEYKGQPQSFNLVVYFSGKYQNAINNTDIVIFSDVSAASNDFFNQTSNKDLLLNSVSFLAKETDLVSLAPKEPSVSRLKGTIPDFNSFFKWTIVGLFLPLPLIFLVLSLFTWYRRRHA